MVFARELRLIDKKRVEYSGIQRERERETRPWQSSVFIMNVRLELYSLSDQQTLAIKSSKEGRDSAKIYVSASSKKRGNLHQ